MKTLVQNLHRGAGASLGSVAAMILVAGLMSPAAVAPAQAGKIATNRMWATAGNKTTPNPIAPKAVRDHRRGICSPWAKTSDDCRKPPGY